MAAAAHWVSLLLISALHTMDDALCGLSGEWVPDKPQHEQRCAPIKSVEIKRDGSLGHNGDPALDGQLANDMTNAMDTLLRGGRRNVRSAAIMGKLGIPVVHTWNQSVPFWDFHRFALPGTPVLRRSLEQCCVLRPSMA